MDGISICDVVLLQHKPLESSILAEADSNLGYRCHGEPTVAQIEHLARLIPAQELLQVYKALTDLTKVVTGKVQH